MPNLKENLFSVGKCIEQGCEVKFTSKSVLFLKENQVCLRGHENSKGVYEINLLPRASQKALIGVSLEEWHKRFANSSEKSIIDLARKDAVKGLSISK